MRSARAHFGGILVTVCVLVSACGGPTTPSTPSPPAETPPPATAPGAPAPPADPAPPATPAPAPPPTPAPPVAAVTLSGTITEAGAPVAGAKVDVQDGPDIGRKAASDATGRYVLDGLTPGSITIKIEKDGYDNSYVKVTLSGPAVAQNVTMTKAAPTPPRTESTGIVFLGSDPAPGGETALTEVGGSVYLTALRMQFAVQYTTALPDAKLEVQLLGDSGQLCAYTFIDQAVPANQSVTISAPNVVWVWETQRCAAVPVATATVKATLLTLRGPEVNGRLQRTDYVTRSFPIRYSIRRYPLPPPGAPASPPVIADLSWHVPLPIGGLPPIPGDPVNIWCTARESDGAAMTVTITVTWEGLAPITSARPFEPGASSSPSGAYHAIGLTAPNTGTNMPHAKVDCAATNVRGETARKSTEFGVRR